MPYVSPNGTIKSTKKLPISNSSKARGTAKVERPESVAGLVHVPSKELGEVSSRDKDARIVRELEYWKGFTERRESENEECEDEGPLGEKSVSGESSVSMESDAKVDGGEKGKDEMVRVEAVEVGLDVPGS
jgi:hypothetical protein